MLSNEKKYWILKAVMMQTPFIIGADNGPMSKVELARLLEVNPEFADYPYKVVEEVPARH